MPFTSKLKAAVVGALLVGALVPHAAHASDSQLSIMQDDDSLVYGGDASRDATLKRMKSLGVDAVRVTVLWSVVADGTDPAVKPKNAKEKAAQTKAIANFKKYGASSPKAYPKGNWDKYDRLDRACQTLKIICYFDVTGPGPSYAMTKPPAKYKKDAAWWKPKPRQFYSFVQAVGKRYGGTYKDENDGKVTLPAIRFWSLWNEPNQGGWLRPQFLNGKPYSPSIYRSLYMFGLRALRSTGHDPNVNDVVLIGETAPLDAGRKTTTAGMGPRTFINELFCGPGSTGLGCSSFKGNGPLVASAWAHHPYTKKLAPNQVDPDPDSITMANFGQIGTLLDSLSATGHVASGMNLISTEYGYETNPPDVTAATNQQQQADYLALGDYITYSNPRVIGNTQFLLRDAKPNKKYKKNSRNYWGTYQSGLYGSTGTPKPAASVYPFTFLITAPTRDPATGLATFTAWGQLRFLPNTISVAAPQTVTLQYSSDAKSWADVGPISVTNALGFFNQPVTVPAAPFYRVTYAGPTGVVASQAQKLP